MTREFDNEAKYMLTCAGIKPTVDDVRVLANDLYTLATDELDAGDDTNCVPLSESASDAVVILKQRIGGLPNLRGYVDVLLAGERRKLATR